MLPSGLLVAAAAAWGVVGSADPTTDLAKQGPLGVAVLALAAFARAAYNREKDRADRLERELSESRDRELAMQAQVAKDVLPLMARATDALTRRKQER